jgi:thiamine-monophosphate kinase
VSDLAAMGASALGIVIAMGLPDDLAVSDFDEIIKGILDACQNYGMILIGGDINESKELTLCGTGLGVVEKDKVLMKSGAREGDIIAVTGPLGRAAAGFEVLFAGEKLQNLDQKIKNKLIKHAIEPKAQLDKGLKLAKSGFVTSATDITDGLLSELGEMIDSNESTTGFTFFEELLPITADVIEISDMLGKNPLDMALNYGEDFELLVTVEEDKFDEIKDELGLNKIGYVTRSGQIHMVNKEGETNILIPRGYEHFKK